MAKALTCHAYLNGEEWKDLAENYSILTLAFLLGLWRKRHAMMPVAKAWEVALSVETGPDSRCLHGIEIETQKAGYNSSTCLEL
jgi:hypothetical protein